MKFLYNIGIYTYSFIVLIASLFSKKAKLMVEGRKKWKAQLQLLKGKEVIWFHAASLGEFEQGRPVLDKVFNEKGDRKVLLTFFSPSGYEIRKNYEKADLVMYLPFDTRRNAKFFLESIDVKMAIFVKYEFWFNFLTQLEKKNISTVFFSVIFRKDQLFFKGWGKWFLAKLSAITKLFVQNEYSQKLLMDFGIKESEVIGDTRFDTVLETKLKNVPNEKVERFLDGAKCILFGSTWSHDYPFIVDFINRYSGEVKFIIAPHEISDKEIESLRKSLKKDSCLYLSDEVEGEILIVNTIGVLKYLYAYSLGSYIGGGFGSGIHNTLEAAAQNQFVVFGPNYQKFQEAKDLIHYEIGSSISSQKEFDSILNKILENSDFRDEIKENSKKYIERNSGASNAVFNFIIKQLNDV